MRLQAAVNAAATALRWSAVAAVGLGVLRLLTGGWMWAVAAVVLIAAATVVAAALRWFTADNWAGAARLVDDRFELHDRAITALEGEKHTGDAVWRLQQNDAEKHLSAHPLTSAAPLSAPRGIAVTFTLLTVAAALLFWPLDMFTPAYQHIPAPGNFTAATPAAPARRSAAMVLTEETPDTSAAGLAAGSAVQNYFSQLSGGTDE